MAEPPTILRVSIGAFRCTLEGFADPVETLIEVTDYVRGLVASDPRLRGRVAAARAAELRARLAEAGEGVVEVRIDMARTWRLRRRASRRGCPASTRGAKLRSSSPP
jgi:hypothetical protein